MKPILFLVLSAATAIWARFPQAPRQLEEYLEDSCYTCLALWPKFYFCSHTTPTRKYGTCCSQYSESFMCRNLDNTTSCSDQIQSPELSHSTCLGVTPQQCGNVGNFEQPADFQNTSISIINVLQSDLTACYWGFTLNSSWSGDSTIYIYLSTVSGFNISIANGSDINSATTLYSNFTKGSTSISVKGSQAVYLVAIPLKATQNQLIFSYRANGTFTQASVEETSFWSQNKAMLISVTIVSVGAITILAIVCIVLKRRKLIQIDPRKLNQIHSDKRRKLSEEKKGDTDRDYRVIEPYSTTSKNVNLGNLLVEDGFSQQPLDSSHKGGGSTVDLSNLDIGISTRLPSVMAKV